MDSSPAFSASRVFLVTGASSGIGRSIAQRLLECGATVLASGRDESKLAASTPPAPIRERYIVVPRDLSLDAAHLSEWVEELASKHGPLSGIVHSAGMLGTSPLRVLSSAFAQRVMELNFYAFLMLAKGLVQDGVRHLDGASLVLLSSVASQRGLSSSVAYSASKGAANAAVLALSAELAPLGIRCNAILPGVVETEMTGGVEQTQIQYLLDQQFIEGAIQPGDVADVCTFLLSDHARFITGQHFTIDAGCGAIPGPRPLS